MQNILKELKKRRKKGWSKKKEVLKVFFQKKVQLHEYFKGRQQEQNRDLYKQIIINNVCKHTHTHIYTHT